MKVPPLIQELKHKCEEIYRLRKFLKIRTKTRVENSQTLKNSQRRLSFNIQGVLYKLRRLLFIMEELSLRDKNGQENGVRFINQ